jgi:hypothetical protein
MKAAGRFQPDDFNLGSLPNISFSLTDNTHEYKLQGTSGNVIDFVRLEAVEVKDSAGNWKRLTEIDIHDLSTTISDFDKTKGVPQYYDTIGNYIYLYPAPSSTQVTLTSGIKVWYTRELSSFSSGDTSPEPSIPEPFHRILSLGASCDWLFVHGPREKYTDLKVEYEQLRKEFREFLSTMNRDIQTKFRPVHNTLHYT